MQTLQRARRNKLRKPLELARHDAATTGRLAPVTRQSLDVMWKLQKPDGGIDWIHVHEAPQAIDDWWPAVMIAVGVAAAPEGCANTEPAATHLELLRGWFRAHPPQTLHERSLTLVADSAIGGILDAAARTAHMEAILARQHDDGGWSVPDLAPWQRVTDHRKTSHQLSNQNQPLGCMSSKGFSVVERGFFKSIPGGRNGGF